MSKLGPGNLGKILLGIFSSIHSHKKVNVTMHALPLDARHKISRHVNKNHTGKDQKNIFTYSNIFAIDLYPHCLAYMK